ncbi:hypothetical protein HDU99_000810, partial [Rhizoclosmatium hyalinum]
DVVGSEGEIFLPLTTLLADSQGDLSSQLHVIETLNIIFSRGNEPEIRALYPNFEAAVTGQNVYVTAMTEMSPQNFANIFKVYEALFLSPDDDLAPLMVQCVVAEREVQKQNGVEEKRVVDAVVGHFKPGLSGADFVKAEKLRRAVARDLGFMMDQYLHVQRKKVVDDLVAMDLISGGLERLVVANMGNKESKRKYGLNGCGFKDGTFNYPTVQPPRKPPATVTNAPKAILYVDKDRTDPVRVSADLTAITVDQTVPIKAQGKDQVVVPVRPFEMEDEEQPIALSEPTMACLKEEIIKTFDFPTDGTMRIYYTMPPSKVSNRKLLSPRAVLSNILKRVKNPETDLVFDFHSFAIVSVTNEQANTMPTVLEISEFDIDALKTEIMKQFQLPNQGFTLHYIDGKTQRKVAVDKSEVLERAILSSSVLVYELATGFTPLSVSSGAISLQDSFQQDAKSRQQYDIFISYNWGTKSEVTALVEQLKLSMPSLKIWMDHKQMQGNIYSAMSGGISSSKLVLACLSKGYLESVNCNMEINFSADLKKPIIPAYFFDEGEDVNGYKQSYGVPFMITAGSLYSDFKRYDVDSPKWQSAFSVLCNEIRHVLHPEPIIEEVTSDSLKLWLNPVDFGDDIHAYASEYVKGTRMWVVDALNDWVDTDERAMWMNGGAGTGKSLIAYSLLVNLPDTYKVGSIFFCRHNDERKRDPVVLVSTMIWNLYNSVDSKEFKDHIETEMKADNVRVKQENKQSILRDPVSAFERIIVEGLKKVSPQERKLLIVVDALDELDILTRKS